MAKFSSPEIKKQDIKYKVEDVLVLYELNKRPTFVKEPTKSFTGHIHSFEIDHKYNSFAKVVSNIRKKELIRENTPGELLKYLTIRDLKTILKSISKPNYGNKVDLINRIEKFASDEDISSSTEKRCFVLTELGLEILNKYMNVVWIAKNKKYIFANPLKYKSKFNEDYFMKHWDISDPIDVMIKHYKSKDSGVVARLYELKNNLEQAFYYGVRKLSEDINFQIEQCKEHGWFVSNIRFEDFGVNRIKKIFHHLNINDESLKDILKYIYEYSIKNTSLITLDTYKEIVISSLNNEDEMHEESVKNLSNSIRKKFGHELHDEVYSHEYNEYEKESLLDILNFLSTDEEHNENMILELVDDLDSEMIRRLKVKIDNRLVEQ